MGSHIDIAAVRALFPAVENMIYLDSGFQTPLCRPVKECIESFLAEGFEAAGPKSVWMKRVEDTRAKVGALLNAAPEEIAFTKNTSESMNIAANALPLKAGDNVLMIHGDHPNNAYAFLNLRRKGVEIRLISMTETIGPDEFRPFIDERTRAISMSHVTFHAGHRFDVAAIGQLCKERGLYFVLDVMQAVGIVPIDAKAIGASMIGSGTHKGLLVPHGLGFLYCDKKLVELEPTYLASCSMANPPEDYIARSDDMVVSPTAARFELGNYNLLAIHALNASLSLIETIGIENIQAHCFDLGDYLIERLELIGVGLVGPKDRDHRAPHIYVVDLSAERWLERFGRNNVRVSPERDGIRVSLGMFSTKVDVGKFVDVIQRETSSNGEKTQAA